MNAFVIAPDGSIVVIYMVADGAGIVPSAENCEGIGVNIKNGNGDR